MKHTHSSHGRFITFEGGEGSGKSTQSKLLLQALEKHGQSALHTREPGGTKGAESIRTLLVEGAADRWDRETELLLHFAARRDHYTKLVKPTCEQGTHVICDRFTDSTVAYQGYGHGISLENITTLERITIGDVTPDITFMLDIDVKKGIERAGKRGDHENRYESMQIAFHERVHKGYLSIAKQEPKRCVVLDATQSIESLHQQILTTLNERFSVFPAGINA